MKGMTIFVRIMNIIPIRGYRKINMKNIPLSRFGIIKRELDIRIKVPKQAFDLPAAGGEREMKNQLVRRPAEKFVYSSRISISKKINDFCNKQIRLIYKHKVVAVFKYEKFLFPAVLLQAFFQRTNRGHDIVFSGQ